jgi:hypothetical protein
MKTEQEIIAEGQRYVRAQQAMIETQRKFIRDLESHGGDAQTVRLEKEALGEMVKSLDLVLSRLRPVIARAGSSDTAVPDPATLVTDDDHPQYG